MIQQHTYINKIKSILPQLVEWINVICAIFLISTLIFPFEYQRPAFYAYASTLFLDIIANRRYKNVKWFNARWVFVVMILFYLCIWIWHIFEETNLPYFQTTAEKRIGLLIAGILGLFTNINPKLKPQYFAIPIMGTSIVTLLYVLFKIDFLHNTYDTFQIYQEAVANYRGLKMNITHMSFNLYTNCGIMFGIYGIMESRKLWSKIIYSTFITLSIPIVMTTEGRIGLFTILILLGILCFYLVSLKNKHLLIPLTTLLIIAISIIFGNHYKMKNDIIINDPRIYIWEESFAMIKDKPIFGYGVSDGRTEFVNRLFSNNKVKPFLNYWFTEFPEYNKYSLHAHNIFLESMLEFGIIGLILIILLLNLPLILTKNKRQIFISIFILIFTLQGLTESPGTHLSIFILSWFLYILILTPIDKKEAIEN